MMLSTVPAYLVSTTGSVGVAVLIDAALQITRDLRNQCIYACSWQNEFCSYIQVVIARLRMGK